MIFADLALSRRLERAESHAGKEFAESRARLYPESHSTWIECAGAIAIFDGPDSPVTQTFGLGLFEDIRPDSLDTIEEFFRQRGAPVLHEISPFAGIGTLDLLSTRGYRPTELSTVMYMRTDPVILGNSHATSDEINVRVAVTEDAALWADLSAKGWASNYPEMKASVRDFGSLAFARNSTVNFLAEIDGIAGATGSLCLYEDVALFGGASTIPAMRHRGLQSALLSTRMTYAYESGYKLAMMVTAVGSQSQRNAERIGFRIAYTRAKWQLTSGSTI